MLLVLSEIVHRPSDALFQAGYRIPADEPPDLADIGNEIPGRLERPLGTEGRKFPTPAPRDADDRLGELAEAEPVIVADIEQVAIGLLRRGTQQHGIDRVIDVEEVAQMRAIPENLDHLVIDGHSDEPVRHPEPV